MIRFSCTGKDDSKQVLLTGTGTAWTRHMDGPDRKCLTQSEPQWRRDMLYGEADGRKAPVDASRAPLVYLR